MPAGTSTGIDEITRNGHVVEDNGKYRLFSSAFAEYLQTQEVHQPDTAVDMPAQPGGESIHKDYRIEAIVVIDLCDSSVIANRYGVDFLMELLQMLRGLIHPTAEVQNVQFLRSKGDDFLITFATALEGLATAREVLMQIQAYNNAPKSGVPIYLHMGIHFGETRIGWEDDRFGDAVNRAFRVAGLKTEDMIEIEGGISASEVPVQNAILISEHVYEELKDIDEVQYRLLGLFKLKGIAERHMIYEVLCPEDIGGES